MLVPEKLFDKLIFENTTTLPANEARQTAAMHETLKVQSWEISVLDCVKM